MSVEFWKLCTHGLKACKEGRQNDALNLLNEAEGKNVRLNHVNYDARMQYLEKLRSHIVVYGGNRTSSNEGGIKRNGKNLDAMGVGSTLISSEVVREINTKEVLRIIKNLIEENEELKKIIKSMPVVDPLSIEGVDVLACPDPAEDFGIIVYGHTRTRELDLLLKSLERQNALQFTEVWLDGCQAKHALKVKIEEVKKIVGQYPVKALHTQNGNFGFRKMMIMGLSAMSRKYRDILILEDDCFPTKFAIDEFRRGLDIIRNDPKFFSVYGHHFKTESEGKTCSRFQGWGWATTSKKLTPILRQLIDCYSMSEDGYLKFVKRALTSDIRAKIDVTPPRQPTFTLEKFFAWDETICLLTALNDQVHMPTERRAVFNCGMGRDSTHFTDDKMFRKPPFNMISPDEVWDYFNG